MSDTFSEADLAPSTEERSRARRSFVDKLATSTAVLSTGLAVGGLISLGACAAPFVFQMTPEPFSGNAMGAAFARFDQCAMGCSAVLLASEMARTFVARFARRTLAARLRRLTAIVFSACIAFVAINLTPAIRSLHASGVERGEGENGIALDALHKKAELVGKIELGLGLLIVGLHVFSLRSREEEEAEEARAPLPPGPRD